MIQDTSGWISIHDVARDMNLVLDDRQAWKAGSLVESGWKWAVGTPPVKDLRRKKSGTGSHCFALYPPQWRERIERAIRTFGGSQDAQLKLF